MQRQRLSRQGPTSAYQPRQSRAEVDFNIVMTAEGRLVEVQGTAESAPFARDALKRLIELGREGIRALMKNQSAVLNR